MPLKIVNTLPESVWREYVLTHPAGNIFHTPEMFAVFAHAVGHRPSLWAAVDEHGRPQALLITVSVTVLNGLFRFLTERAVAYGGILATNEAAVETMLSAYRSAVRGVLFTELRNLTDAAAWQLALKAHGFVYEPHLNYLVDLAGGPEAVVARFKKRLRTTVRRAQRAGAVRLVTVSDRAQLAEVYALLQATYAAAHLPLADRSLFEAAFDQLHPSGQVWFTLAYVGDRAVACSVELAFKQVVYGWYGGLDRSAGVSGANEWMLADIMQRAARAGYRVYDFGGAGRPDEPYGVRDFKAKFGGELVNYGRNLCVHSPLRFQVSQFAYRMLRRILYGGPVARSAKGEAA